MGRREKCISTRGPEVARRVLRTQLADLVEHGHAGHGRNEVVAPDPLVLDVVLDGELGYLRGESVWVAHGASSGFLGSSFVGHGSRGIRSCGGSN